MHWLWRILAVVITLVYPFGVYLGLQYFNVRTLVLLILIVAGLRLLTLKNSPLNHWLWIPLLLVLALWTWLAESQLGLKLYPVFIHLSFLVMFASSLFFPPSMIERFAVLAGNELGAPAQRYATKATIAWCGYFLCSSAIALATCIWASDAVWAIYNGFIAYLLLGAMFGGEWLVRQWVRRHG